MRDQFSLRIYGQRPMKILFDERTQVYRDGVKDSGARTWVPKNTPLFRRLWMEITYLQSAFTFCRDRQRASAMGGFSGTTGIQGELTVASSMSPVPIRLFVSANASIATRGGAGVYRGAFRVIRPCGGESDFCFV